MYFIFHVIIIVRHAARWEAGGAAAPPDFGGSVNPISTRGDTLSPPSTTCPPGFLTLGASLLCSEVCEPFRRF